jgi:hypothetical protein
MPDITRFAGIREKHSLILSSSSLILSLLMLHICGVSKTFGEWYQKVGPVAQSV